jgi:DNA-binding CsgD family transcriptional regulator
MLSPYQLGKPSSRESTSLGQGNDSSLDRYLLQITSAIGSREDLAPVILSIIAEFGFEHFAYAVDTASHPNRDSRTFVWTTMPWQWMAEYDQKAYMEIDPRITMTWGRNAPLVWDATEFAERPKLAGFFSDAARYGTRSGVAIGFSDPAYSRIGFFYNSPISPVGPRRRAAINSRLGDLMVFSARFHDLFVANYLDKNNLLGLPGIPLSPRERECLGYAARGMTSADIGAKLGISERTANFHFSNIVSKLGAVNRKEAIAFAVAQGIVRIEI